MRHLFDSTIGVNQRVYFLIALTLAVVLSISFFLNPVVFWPDQGAVLEAASRLANGHGLSNLSLRSDISQPVAEPMIAFPPGLALIAASMIWVGISPDMIVKLLNLAALLAGVFGWVRLCERFISDRAFRILFAVLLSTSCGAAVPTGGTADYLLWAAVPYWILLMAAYSAQTSATHEAKYLIVASSLVSALIGIRWAAAAFVPCGCLIVIVLVLRGAKRWQRVVGHLALYATLPTFTFFLISVVNKTRGGKGGTVLAFVEDRWQFDKLLTSYPLRAFTLIPLGLEPIIDRVHRLLGDYGVTMQSVTVWRVVVSIVVLLACVIAAKLFRHRPASFVVNTKLIAFCTLGVTLVFLATMSVRYTWSDVNWSYLDEPRYFRPFFPLIALLLFSLLIDVPPCKRWVRRAAVLALTISALYSFQAQMRTSLHALVHTADLVILRAQLLGIPLSDRRIVVFDNDISDHRLLGRSDMTAFTYPEPNAVSALTVSSPTDVWVVRRLKEKTQYVTEADFDLKRTTALIERFGAKKEWASSNGAFELYAKKDAR